MKKYKILSILGLILPLIPLLVSYFIMKFTDEFTNISLLNFYPNLSLVMWIVAIVFGIISTIVFLKNIKDIKLYWLIPAVLSIVFNLGFLFVNAQ